VVVVTRKTATSARAEAAVRALAGHAPNTPCARAHLGLAGVARYGDTAGDLGEIRPVGGLRCALALAGVARPGSLLDQLRAGGACVESFRAYPDHHRYSAADIAHIRDRARDGPIVMTLKDVVKLAGALPDAEIYVAMQEVIWESGVESIEELIADRTAAVDAGGSSRNG
jgi:tetraacyldisaccharide-1-P 4'-kinase